MEGERPGEMNIMGGLTAACPKAIIDCLVKITSIVDLYRKIKRHLNWTNRRPSCFVSTFENFLDAVRWGMQFDGTVRIYSIETTELPPMLVYVFRPSNFDTLWPKDEYLFLHQIPDRGIECFVVLPDELKTISPSLQQSMNQSSPDPEPSPKSHKRKREEDVVSSSKNPRVRTNAGNNESVVPTKEDGNGKG